MGAGKKIYLAEFDAYNAAYNKKVQDSETRTVAAVNKISAANAKMKSGFDLSGAALLKIGGVAVLVRSAFNFLKEARDLALEQVKAERKVEQGVISTGKAAGWSAKQIKEMASELQTITGIGDEAILSNVSGQLLTFTNITGKAFERAHKAILDVNAVINNGEIGSLTSQSIQLGKALNDPIANLGALSRVGIQFSAQQKEQIKNYAEHNQLAKAQAIILDELERQYGGQAEALAKATDGTMQLEAAIGDKMEIIGSGLNPVYKTYLSLMDSALGLLIPTKDAVRDEYININILASEMLDANTANEERIKLYGKLKEINPDIVKGIDRENISLERLSSNLEEYNSKLIDRILLQRKEAELLDAAEKGANLRETKASQELKLRTQLAEVSAYLNETESKHRKEQSLGYEKLTQKLNAFNEIMGSNLTLEEKVDALYKAKLLGGPTNWWTNEADALRRINSELGEQSKIMNSLGKEARTLKSALGYDKPLLPQSEDGQSGYIDDPLLGDIPEDVIQRAIKIREDAKKRIYENSAIGKLATANEALFDQYREIDEALKNGNLTKLQEIQLMKEKLDLLDKLEKAGYLIGYSAEGKDAGQPFKYNKNLLGNDDLRGRGLNKTEDVAKPISDSITDYTAVGEMAFDSMFDMAMIGFDELRIRASTNASAMEHAFVNMGNVVVRQIEAILAKWALLSIFSFIGGGAGVGIMSVIEGKASGGAVNSRTTYMVGERGPELFLPNQSGYVVPNFQLPSFSMPQSSIANYNSNFSDKNIVNSLSETNNLLRAQNMDLIKLMHGAASGKMSSTDFEKVLTKFVTRGQRNNTRNNVKIGR